MEEIPNLNLNWLKYPFKMEKIPNIKKLQFKFKIDIFW